MREKQLLLQGFARVVRRWAGSLLGLGAAALIGGCSSEGPSPPPTVRDWPCEIPAGSDVPDYVLKTGCQADFLALASRPLDASIPGARSGKVVFDLKTKILYYQDSNRYDIHYKFANATKDAQGEPLFGGTLASFNAQYTLGLEQRRFLLGAVTYYEQPDIWALEIAPYDNSTPAMIEMLFDAVRDSAFYGPVLAFHPTSDTVESVAKTLARRVVTTDQLFAEIQYQPLNVGDAVGKLKLLKAEDLAENYVSIRDIVVLDEAPNDISATAAIVTETFQTPLSHINVLARNRGTPNMGLRGAMTHPDIAPLVGKPVRLHVGSFEWSIEEVSQATADEWFEAHKPAPVDVPPPNIDVKDLRDIATVTEHTDEFPYVSLEALQAATLAFGAKAANYSVFATDPVIPHKPAFAIPAYFYVQYMTDNGIFAQLEQWKADAPSFDTDDELRKERLAELREMVLAGAFSEEFETALKAKLDADFPGEAMRFRSSTNAEDLAGFPCAGCYDSHTGDPSDFDGDQLAACLQAIRKTWATVWNLRTYDERMIHGIEHENVAMALLVHTNFPAEEANGVAITANIFDATGTLPGFYVNVQYGGQYEVVHPPPGITSDSFLYQYLLSNPATTYYTTSNVLPADREHVLSRRQVHDLGVALDQINLRFAAAYRPKDDPLGWYAMDCEFKFDDAADPSKEATLYIKQARPYPKSASIAAGD